MMKRKRGRTMRTEQEITKSEMNDEQGSIIEKKKWNTPKVESLNVGSLTQAVSGGIGDGIDNHS
jgi:hypothetical protein